MYYNSKDANELIDRWLINEGYLFEDNKIYSPNNNELIRIIRIVEDEEFENEASDDHLILNYYKPNKYTYDGILRSNENDYDFIIYLKYKKAETMKIYVIPFPHLIKTFKEIDDNIDECESIKRVDAWKNEYRYYKFPLDMLKHKIYEIKGYPSIFDFEDEPATA